MNKKLLYKLQLAAGGSLYPSINPQIQEKFAELLLQECYDAIDECISGLDDSNEQIGAEYAAYAIEKRFN